MVINSKPNSRIANLSFSHTSTTTTAANGNTVVVDDDGKENQRPSKRSYICIILQKLFVQYDFFH